MNEKELPRRVAPIDASHALSVLTSAHPWKSLPAELKQIVWKMLMHHVCFSCDKIIRKGGVLLGRGWRCDVCELVWEDQMIRRFNKTKKNYIKYL